MKNTKKDVKIIDIGTKRIEKYSNKMNMVCRLRILLRWNLSLM